MPGVFSGCYCTGFGDFDDPFLWWGFNVKLMARYNGRASPPADENGDYAVQLPLRRGNAWLLILRTTLSNRIPGLGGKLMCVLQRSTFITVPSECA